MRQGDTSRAARSLLALSMVVGCGGVSPGDDGLPGPLVGIDDGAEPADEDPSPDGDPAPTPGDDDVPEPPADPSCVVMGCPDDAPLCSDSGQCVQCIGVSDCDAAACLGGECVALPNDGRIAWLRAADLESGTAVASWPGVGDSAAPTQAEPERRPWVALAGPGDLATVWFDGQDDRLQFDDADFVGSSNARTIVAVLVTEDDGRILGRDDGSGLGLTVELGRPQVSGGDDAPLWPRQHLLDGVPRVVTARADADGVSLRLEGSLAALSQTPSASIPLGAPALGASVDDMNPAFRGGIAELIVYERALSDAELELVESYLAQRHAITPPSAWATLDADVSVFYPLDEVGPGLREDTQGNLPLAPFPGVDGITTVPGVVGQAQHIDGAYGGYHFFRNGGAAQLDHSTESFTWAGWVAIDPLEATDPYLVPQTLVGKWDPPSECQVRVWFEPVTRRWSVSVAPTGQAQDAITLTHPTVVPPGQFVLVQAWRDAMRGELGMRVGAPGELGEPVTIPMAESMPTMANDLNVAAHATCSDGFLQGTVDALGQWHRPLTEAESAALADGFEPG